MARLYWTLWSKRVIVALMAICALSQASMAESARAQENGGATWNGDFDRVPPEACGQEHQVQPALSFTEFRDWQSESGEVFGFQRAPFINEQGEIFLVTVLGQQDDATALYIESARYCFDFIPASPMGLEDAVEPDSPEVVDDAELEDEAAGVAVAISVEFLGGFPPDIVGPDVLPFLRDEVGELLQANPDLAPEDLTDLLVQSASEAVIPAGAMIEQAGSTYYIDFAIMQESIGDGDQHQYTPPGDAHTAWFGIAVEEGSASHVEATLSAPRNHNLGRVTREVPADGDHFQEGSLASPDFAESFCISVLGLGEESGYRLSGRLDTREWSDSSVAFEIGEC